MKNYFVYFILTMFLYGCNSKDQNVLSVYTQSSQKTYDEKKLIEQINLYNYTIMIMGVANYLGDTEGCIETTKNDYKSNNKWIELRAYLLKKYKVYLMLSDNLSKTLNDKYPNSIDSKYITTISNLNKIKENSHYKMRYLQMLGNNKDCYDFSEESIYSTKTLGLGLAHEQAYTTLKLLKEVYPMYHALLMVTYNNLFPDHPLYKL